MAGRSPARGQSGNTTSSPSGSARAASTSASRSARWIRVSMPPGLSMRRQAASQPARSSSLLDMRPRPHRRRRRGDAARRRGAAGWSSRGRSSRPRGAAAAGRGRPRSSRPAGLSWFSPTLALARRCSGRWISSPTMRQPGTRTARHKVAAPLPAPGIEHRLAGGRGHGRGQQHRVDRDAVALRRLAQAHPTAEQAVLGERVRHRRGLALACSSRRCAASNMVRPRPSTGAESRRCCLRPR